MYRLNLFNFYKTSELHTPGPLYNALHYNIVSVKTLFIVGPQLVILDFFAMCLYILLLL